MEGPQLSMLKMEENKDYELIPSPTDSTVWQVRILTGDYVETIIEFDTIRLNEIKEHISFNFNIIESPDAALNIDDENLHFVLARVLADIIERGDAEGWVKLTERKPIDEYKNRTDDTSKIIN